MKELNALLADISASKAQHARDKALFQYLNTLAVLGDTQEECGQHLLEICDSDLARALEHAKFLQREVNRILVDWLICARLTLLETTAGGLK